MPTGNERGLFKNKTAKFLAKKYNLSMKILVDILCLSDYQTTNGKYTSKKNYITEHDIKYYIDNLYYKEHGIAFYNKSNVPKEKRFDTDWNAYTLNEFKNYYGNDDYKINWNKAIIYKPNENEII